MKRYWSSYKLFFTLGIQKFLTYRADSYMHLFIGNTAWSFFTVFSIYALTSKTQGMFGWSREELIILSCIYNVFIGIFSIIFMRNLQELSEIINSGKLDGYLLKPVDSQFLLSVKTVHVSSILRTLIGFVIAVIAVITFKTSISAINILLFIPMLIAGELLLYSLLFIISTSLIWYPRLDNLTDLFYTIRGFGRYPQGVYQQLPQLIFLLLAPFIILLATPTKVLLGKASTTEVIELLILSAVFFITSRIFWRYSLRFYTSASG